MNEYYVYVHRRATTGEPFYYGKGKGDRAYIPDRNDWHDRVVKKYGMRVDVLFSNLTEIVAYFLEVSAIDFARSRGENITNKTSGGEGFTSETASKAGKLGGKTNAINKTGVCGRSPEKMSEDGKKSGAASAKANKERGTGMFAFTTEQRVTNGKKLKEDQVGFNGFTREQRSEVGKSCRDRKTGIFSFTFEQLSEQGKKGGKIGGKIGGRVTGSKRYKCLDCGKITTIGPLSYHQKATGHQGKEYVA